jgi:hypothetical protein
LGAAFAANALTHAGQPALVYIVPAMFCAVSGQALARREVGRMGEYTDGGAAAGGGAPPPPVAGE